MYVVRGVAVWKTRKKTMMGRLRHISRYVLTLLKWLVVAAVTGVICGAVGTLFDVGVEEATAFR